MAESVNTTADRLAEVATNEVIAAVEVALSREVQALHAGLSRRDWSATERAANELRDRLQFAMNEWRLAQRATGQ